MPSFLEASMRLSLPILLLTATAAMAQTQPASPEKPYVDDRVQLCPLNGPAPEWCKKPEMPKPLPPKSAG